ncbi:hypothetical protein [Paraburkholderia sp. BR14320]|uniref:hypothetical protein n=1 Tax=Paraburkholderia sp. BR14320 TaxID=3237006 RepID=UPI0034CDC9E2
MSHSSRTRTVLAPWSFFQAASFGYFFGKLSRFGFVWMQQDLLRFAYGSFGTIPLFHQLRTDKAKPETALDQLIRFWRQVSIVQLDQSVESEQSMKSNPPTIVEFQECRSTDCGFRPLATHGFFATFMSGRNGRDRCEKLWL